MGQSSKIRYEDIQGWFNYQRVFDIAVNKYNNASFVEIGCWKGKSTRYLGDKINESGKKIRVYCIDTWEGSPYEKQHKELISELGHSLYEEFMNNMDGLYHIINPIKLDSVSASARFNNKTLDFVYIDGGHTYEEVIADIRAWLPKVKNGGMIAGHDYGNSKGVVKAVNEMFDKFELIKNSWIVYV